MQWELFAKKKKTICKWLALKRNEVKPLQSCVTSTYKCSALFYTVAFSAERCTFIYAWWIVNYNWKLSTCIRLIEWNCFCRCCLFGESDIGVGVFYYEKRSCKRDYMRSSRQIVKLSLRRVEKISCKWLDAVDIGLGCSIDLFVVFVWI